MYIGYYVYKKKKRGKKNDQPINRRVSGYMYTLYILLIRTKKKKTIPKSIFNIILGAVIVSESHHSLRMCENRCFHETFLVCRKRVFRNNLTDIIIIIIISYPRAYYNNTTIATKIISHVSRAATDTVRAFRRVLLLTK